MRRSPGPNRVVVSPEGNMWVVRFNGVKQTRHRLKRRAREEGRKIARQGNAILVVQDRGGRFHGGRSYGN